MTLPYAYLTADITRPDGSDTDGYGEPCEDGYGTVYESGWLSPSWSLWTVFENRDDVERLTYDPADELTIDEWVTSLIDEHIGSPDGMSNFPTVYAADTHHNYTTGETSRLAIHFYGLESE